MSRRAAARNDKRIKSVRVAPVRSPCSRVAPVSSPEERSGTHLWSLTALCGLTAALIVYLFIGNHSAISLDEGIPLYGAERILAGQIPYRDFFATTGPGTFVLLACLFKLLPGTVALAHALLSLELGIIVACAYSVVSNSFSKLAGLATALSIVALFLAFSNRLYMNHRWDSSCCVALASTLLFFGAGRTAVPAQKRVSTASLMIMAAGVVAGCAIIFTPSTVVVLVTLGAGLFIGGRKVPSALFLAASAMPLAATVLWLGVHGGVSPMLQDFAWVGRHYARANAVPYGFSPPDPNGRELSYSLRDLHIYLPAALPLFAVACVGMMLYKRRPIRFGIWLLLASGLGLAGSCYPRVATNNLLFAAPLLLGVLILTTAELVKNQYAYQWILVSFIGLSGLSLIASVTRQPETTAIATQFGTIQCSTRDFRNVAFATSVIEPGDSLFVYPYQPIWYSLTGGINPTRFDFLQPGMMTLDDESEALRELNARPPQWILWHSLPTRTVLAIWPNSDPASLHFTRMEAFIRSHYAQVHPPDMGQHYGIAIFKWLGGEH